MGLLIKKSQSQLNFVLGLKLGHSSGPNGLFDNIRYRHGHQVVPFAPLSLDWIGEHELLCRSMSSLLLCLRGENLLGFLIIENIDSVLALLILIHDLASHPNLNKCKLCLDSHFAKYKLLAWCWKANSKASGWSSGKKVTLSHCDHRKKTSPQTFASSAPWPDLPGPRGETWPAPVNSLLVFIKV